MTTTTMMAVELFPYLYCVATGCVWDRRDGATAAVPLAVAADKGLRFAHVFAVADEPSWLLDLPVHDEAARRVVVRVAVCDNPPAAAAIRIKALVVTPVCNVDATAFLDADLVRAEGAHLLLCGADEGPPPPEGGVVVALAALARDARLRRALNALMRALLDGQLAAAWTAAPPAAPRPFPTPESVRERGRFFFSNRLPCLRVDGVELPLDKLSQLLGSKEAAVFAKSVVLTHAVFMYDEPDPWKRSNPTVLFVLADASGRAQMLMRTQPSVLYYPVSILSSDDAAVAECSSSTTTLPHESGGCSWLLLRSSGGSPNQARPRAFQYMQGVYKYAPLEWWGQARSSRPGSNLHFAWPRLSSIREKSGPGSDRNALFSATCCDLMYLNEEQPRSGGGLQLADVEAARRAWVVIRYATNKPNSTSVTSLVLDVADGRPPLETPLEDVSPEALASVVLPDARLVRTCSRDDVVSTVLEIEPLPAPVLVGQRRVVVLRAEHVPDREWPSRARNAPSLAEVANNAGLLMSGAWRLPGSSSDAATAKRQRTAARDPAPCI